MLKLILLNCLVLTTSLLDYSLIYEFSQREQVNAMVLLHCDESELAEIFKQVSVSFPGNLLTIELDEVKFYQNHVRYMATQHFRQAIVIDLDCPIVNELLEFCSSQEYFNGSYRWLLFSNDKPDKTFALMKKQNLNIDSRVTVVISETRLKGAPIAIYEVYGTLKKRGGKMHIVSVGFWNSESDRVWNCSTFSYRTRSNFDGITLWSIVSVLGAPKHITMDDYLGLMEPPKNYVANRLGYRTALLLSNLLNFKVVHILTTEWGFDVVGKKSTKGIIGQLQQNVVDFSTAPLAITSERMGSFDQTVDLVTRRIITIFRHPKNGGTRNVFLHPFQNSLWLSLGLVMIISSGLFLIGFVLRNRGGSIGKVQFLLMIFGLFCQQSFSGTTSVFSSRIILLTMLLFSITVYQFYSCFIIGYLLVLPPKNIKSIEQLTASDLKFSIEDVPYNRDYFNRTKNVLARELFEKKVIQSDTGYVNVSLGVDLVKRGNHAFHCDTSYVNTWIMESFTDYEQCELQEVETYPVRPLQIVIPKGSPLKEPFRISIRLMMDTGLVQYYRRKFFLKRPPCSTDSFATVQVGFADISSLFVLLLAGLVISVCVLAVEIVAFRVRMHLEVVEFSKQYTGWVD